MDKPKINLVPSAFLMSCCLMTLASMLCLWGVSFYPFSTLLDLSNKPIGNDFVQFYISGTQVLNDFERTYQKEFQLQSLRQIFPDISTDFYLPYWYPPFLSILFYPLSDLTYLCALLIFSTASFLALSLSIRLLVLQAPAVLSVRTFLMFLLIAFCFPAVIDTILSGQLSVFGLLIVSFAVYCIIESRLFVAGLVLGLAFYKPNLLGLFIYSCLLLRPAIIFGLLTSISLIAFSSFLLLGWNWIDVYQTALAKILSSQDLTATVLYKYMSLINVFQADPTLKLRIVSIIFGLISCTYFAMKFRNVWGESKLINFQILMLMLILNILFNPYLPLYDLTLLLPALILPLFRMIKQQRNSESVFSRLCFVAIFLGPYISQLLAILIQIQPYPLVLVAVFIWQLKFLKASYSLLEK